MNNTNNNLKIGSSGVGLYVGNTEILGGGNNVIYDYEPNSSDFIYQLFMNCSDYTVTITVQSFTTGVPNTTLTLKSGVNILYKLKQESEIQFINSSGREVIYEYMYSYWDDDMVIGRDHYSISENTDVIHRVNHLNYNYNGTFIFINP